jgi:FixJ family two-component response regulator
LPAIDWETEYLPVFAFEIDESGSENNDIERGRNVLQPPLIACIDDDAFVREGLAGLLQAFGFSAEVFASAEEFLNYRQLERVSCLITDVKLEGISGIQLQNCLKKNGHKIPTIIISAYEKERLEAQALDQGAIAFHRKPISSENLLSSLDLALNRGSGDG